MLWARGLWSLEAELLLLVTEGLWRLWWLWRSLGQAPSCQVSAVEGVVTIVQDKEEAGWTGPGSEFMRTNIWKLRGCILSTEVECTTRHARMGPRGRQGVIPKNHSFVKQGLGGLRKIT